MKKFILAFLSLILIFTSLNLSAVAAEEVSTENDVVLSEEEILIEKMDHFIDEAKEEAQLIGERADTGGGYLNLDGEFVDPVEKLSEEEFLKLQELSEDLDVDYFSNETPVTQARIPIFLAPLVIAVIRQAVIHLGKKHLMRSFTKHALQRGGERRIKETWVANAIAKGQKFVDKDTGAKILWDKSSGTTLVMTKDARTVTTMYRQGAPKKVWKSTSF